MAIFWGPDFRLLYNGACLSMLGDNHPGSLGQQAAVTWAEMWPTIGPMLTGVLRDGTADLLRGPPPTLERAGYLEEGILHLFRQPDRRPGQPPDRRRVLRRHR